MSIFFPRPIAERGLFKGVSAAFELFRNIGIADDRSGYELREKRHVCRKVNRIFLRRNIAAVNIDRIAEYLEGVKADAYRESDLEQRDRKSGNGVEVAYKKVNIFEISEHCKTACDREDHKQL